METCKKCGKAVFSADSVSIRGNTYCCRCARSIPSCDKCRWHYRHVLYPEYGCCAYFKQYLQDYDNVCRNYEAGHQEHPNVYTSDLYD